MRNPIQTIAFSMIFLGVLLGCSRMSEDLTSTEEARDTQQSVFLTLTPLPTYTPNPTYTPYPAFTPVVIILEIPEREGQGFWPTEPLGRDYYAQVDIETSTLIPTMEFRLAYAEAVKNDEEWIKDPINISLRYSGYPNLDGVYPNQVFVYQNSGNQAIVIIRAFNLLNDSIKDTDDRIELVKENGIWRIEWAGFRQRCYRSPFDGWTTGLCP